MDDVIKRVREYGELLAKGAPHQHQIGKDIREVADVALLVSAPLMKIDDDGKTINVSATINADLEADLEKDLHDLRQTNRDLVTASAEIAETARGPFVAALQHIARCKFHPDDNPFMNYLRNSARGVLENAGIVWNDVDVEGFTMVADARDVLNGLHDGDGVDLTLSDDSPNARMTEAIDTHKSMTDIKNDDPPPATEPHLTKAEKKARAKALQDELDKSGKHEPVDDKKK